MIEFKQIMAEQGKAFESDEEALQAAYNLAEFYDIIFRIAAEDLKRKERLKTEPKGFAMPGKGRSCPLCRQTAESFWYDKYGLKCMECQDAINKKIIPGYVFKDYNNNKHITADMLSWRYKIRTQTTKRLIKEGKIKVRVVPHKDVVDTLVLLRKENPDLVTILRELQSSKRAN